MERSKSIKNIDRQSFTDRVILLWRERKTERKRERKRETLSFKCALLMPDPEGTITGLTRQRINLLLELQLQLPLSVAHPKCQGVAQAIVMHTRTHKRQQERGRGKRESERGS